MKYTHIVWDFNGTVLCDMQAGMDAVNKMLGDRGLKTLSGIDEYRRVFDFPIIEYYRNLGFDFEKEDYYTVLAPLWVGLYLENCKKSPLCDGITEMIGYFRNLKIPQILLSATEQDMLKRQIKDLNLDGCFDQIIGLDNIHAHGKGDLAIQWRAQNPTAVPLFIGDTTHDHEVASRIGADCILYSGGHMAAEKLVDRGCPVVNDLREIKQYVK